MRSINQKMAYTVVASAMTLGLAACGGSDGDSEATTEKPVTPPVEEVTKGPAIDPYYGVCRGTDPKCLNDWGAFKNTPDRVLIYSRTAGPRHANLGPVMAKGLNPTMDPKNEMQAGLVRMLNEAGIQADWTEDVTVLSGRINNYKTIISASANRDTLWNADVATSNDAARTALRNYMRRGGGFVGLHNAFGAEYNFPYYEGLLGNANFYNHGPNRDGTVQLMNADPSTAGVSLNFAFKDEWYNLAPFPTNVKFLAQVDTKTLNPLTSAPHPGHAGFHPVAWCQYYDGGRAWLTTLGHAAGHFTANSTDPGAADFQKMVVQAVKSTMGLTPFCTAN